MTAKVLIVDHDPAVSELLGHLLGSYGYEVATAETGAEGLRLARELRPAVVVLEMALPDRDGCDICQSIRSFSDVPILTLSASSDPHVVASILDSGADDHLTRPVSSSVVLAHVQKLARRQRLGRGEILPLRASLPTPTQPFHP